LVCKYTKYCPMSATSLGAKVQGRYSRYAETVVPTTKSKITGMR
jgi:hypothetical protein